MTLLLLAGSGEAQQIARHLADQKADAIVSLARGARGAWDLPLRSGGFGGAQGFRDYLTGQGITAVLDATHPFAAQISRRSARICAEMAIPYCLVRRPAWAPGPGDRWTLIDTEEDVAQHVAPGTTVFLATGRQTLERFANLSHATLICRQLEPGKRVFPFENGRFLLGVPPFSVADETRLFAELGVDWLVVKNAGGAAPATKLTAARDLGIRVAMINRPAAPDAPRVHDVEGALDWVAAL